MRSISRVLIALCGLAAPALAAPCPPADLFGTTVAQIDGGKLAFCDFDKHTCWELDAAAGTWSTQPMTTPPAVTVGPTDVTACAAGGKDCVKIATNDYKDGGTGIANDDRSMIAVWNGPAVEVYDAKTSKRLAQIKTWKSPMGPGAAIQQAWFVGPSLAVWESWSPVSSSARLYDPRTGKRRGDIGKAGAEVEPWAVQVDADTWAFAGFDPKLYLVRVATGALKKTIALGGGPTGKVIPGKLADGRIAIVADGVLLVDPAKGKVTTLAAPTCAK